MTSIGLALNEDQDACVQRPMRVLRFSRLHLRARCTRREPADAITVRGLRRRPSPPLRTSIRRRLRPGNQAPWEDVARDLNRTVRGWAAYFSYGSVSKARHAVKLHLYHAVRRFLRRRHKVAGSGYRQFPMPARVWGTGRAVVRILSSSSVVRAHALT